MESKPEEKVMQALRPTENETSDTDFNKEKNVQNERLSFEVEDLKLDERNQICEEARRKRRSKKKSCKKKSGFEEKPIQTTGVSVSDSVFSTATCIRQDMTISRSCRFKINFPVMFWTTVFLILLARGVNSVKDEPPRFKRSPKYETDGDVQGALTAANMQETYNVMQFLRELLQRQQQQQRSTQQQLQVYNNGEDLSDIQIDWRKVPLPLLYQIRSIINDGSKEEDKRGSYMSLCHFKICNLG